MPRNDHVTRQWNILNRLCGSRGANSRRVGENAASMTRDIDLVIELAEQDTDRVVKLFQADFYIDRDAVQAAIHRKSMFNIIHTDSVLKVDFVVRKESEYRRKEFSRRRQVSVEGHAFHIVARKISYFPSWSGPRTVAPKSNSATCVIYWPACPTLTATTWRTGPAGWEWSRCIVRSEDDGYIT